MITIFTGTPGSGKSLECCQEVEFWLKILKKNVIANVQYNRDYILKGKPGGKFYYLDNINFKPDFFYKYALKFHKLGVESQTLIVIDEAQVLYSPTACKLFSELPIFPAPICSRCKKKDTNDCLMESCSILPRNKSYRQDWLEFYSQHRHLGFDVVLISQFDRLIDAQLRCLFEYNYVHRKANNFRTAGRLLTILGIKFFIQVQYWYGAREKNGSKMFFYKKRYSKMYDSYNYREKIVQKLRTKYGDDFVDRLVNPQFYKEKQKNKQLNDILLWLPD